LFEGYLWSSTYWCWTDGFKEAPYAAALNRAYPQTTGGQLAGYRYDYDAERLEMDFVPNGGETLVYHPRAARLIEENVSISGTEGCRVEMRPFSESEGGLVAVYAPKGDRRLTVRIGGPR